jgi:F-box interacting protein
MPLFYLHRDDSTAPPELNPPNLRVRLEAVDLRARASQTLIRFAVAQEHRHILSSEVTARRLQRRRGSAAPTVRTEIKEPSAFDVHGSCDGVLLVSHGWALFAYNPATRRWARLPGRDNRSTIVGFYAHRPTGEFRVLVVSREPCRAEHWILAIGRGMTQRRIATHEFLSDQNRLRPACESPPALVSGCLHWLPQSLQSNRDLLVFDTLSETFRWMHPPPALEVDGDGQALLELDGMLTMTVVARGDLAQLWVMRDYEQQAWFCKLQVSLPVDHIGRFGGVAIVSQKGDVVIQCERCLLQCDSMGRVQKHHQLEHHRSVAVPHMFKENIVPHDCLDRQHPTAGWEGRQIPPFFRDMRDGCYYRT